MTAGRSVVPWNPEALPDPADRTYTVTSGNAGIGRFLSEQSAAACADGVNLGRRPDRIRVAAEAPPHRTAGVDVTAVPLELVDPEYMTSAAAALTSGSRGAPSRTPGPAADGYLVARLLRSVAT